MTDATTLTGEEIKIRVLAKLDEYENLSHLEQYAMFMGKAQILEFGLKILLTRKFGIPPESMEKWTLGKVKDELKNQGLRTDFIALLKSVVAHRNNMAHEFLVNNAITKTLADFSERKLYGDRFRAIYEIEQIIILHDWCEMQSSWQKTTRPSEQYPS